MKITIIINTYNRPQMLLNLLNDLKNETVLWCHPERSRRVNIKIYDDHSNQSYQPVYTYIKNNLSNTCEFYRMPQHYGKPWYWKITNFIYQSLQNETFDYVIQLPDDVRLQKGFIKAAVTNFNKIQDSKKACLNILCDISRRLMPMWTPVQPTMVKHGDTTFVKTGWVDMCYIAKKTYFETLQYAILPVSIAWGKNPKKSSGVGMQISQRIYDAGKTMYMMNYSILNHGNHESQMHPTHRKYVPIISKTPDKITATMAAIPTREKALKDVVSSIIDQVDELQVYLNEWDHVPGFLNHKKIIVFRSQEEIGDIGDVGKFYQCEKIKGYHFTIDDDIVYPPDYVEKTIVQLEKHDRKYAITYHGKQFNKMPVATYYRGATAQFACLRMVVKDIFLHIGGTGVMAFHTNTVKLKLSMFQTSNMGDIWFSKYCNENNIPILCINHPEKWIKLSPHFDNKDCIFAWCSQNDAIQTEIVNGVKWNKLPNLSS